MTYLYQIYQLWSINRRAKWATDSCLMHKERNIHRLHWSPTSLGHWHQARLAFRKFCGEARLLSCEGVVGGAITVPKASASKRLASKSARASSSSSLSRVKARQGDPGSGQSTAAQSQPGQCEGGSVHLKKEFKQPLPRSLCFETPYCPQSNLKIVSAYKQFQSPYPVLESNQTLCDWGQTRHGFARSWRVKQRASNGEV